MKLSKKSSILTSTSWPANGLEAVKKCPVCGSQRRRVIHTDLKDRVFYCAPGNWTMYRCHECRCAYLDPRPNEETIGIAYKRYFTHEITSDGTGRPRNFQTWFRIACDNSYLNWRFGTSYKPASALWLLFARMMPLRRNRLEAKMRHLSRPEAGMSILDFGCGNGDFLVRARDMGWEVRGIDFDPEAVSVARAKGLQVDGKGMNDLQSINNQFDVITLSHVIEHVHDPILLIDLCYRSLKPGGVLWLETPNINSQGHDVYGANWRGLEPPRHLILFTHHSLVKVLHSAGFRAVENMPEHPSVRVLFCSSEAIQSEAEVDTPKNKCRRSDKKRWRHYQRRAFANYGIREFITLTATK